MFKAFYNLICIYDFYTKCFDTTQSSLLVYADFYSPFYMCADVSEAQQYQRKGYTLFFMYFPILNTVNQFKSLNVNTF